MKKKMLVAFFAMMSVASVSAYTVTVNNQTNHRVRAIFAPMNRMVIVNGQQTQRINLSQAATIIGAYPVSRMTGLQSGLFNIPQSKIGKNITINIGVFKRQKLSLSEPR